MGWQTMKRSGPPRYGMSIGQRPTTTCAAVGCQLQIPRPLLMCVDHWRRVPAALRRQVWAAYQRVGRDPDGASAHLEAVKLAVQAVHEKALTSKAKRDAATPDLFG